MKLFNKEYCYPEILQEVLEDFTIIDEDHPTEEEIQEIYEEEKSNFLEELREEYDKSPIDYQLEVLKEAGTELEDIKIWDLDENGNMINERSPRDENEVREYLAKGLEEEIKGFESREDFDYDEFGAYFDDIYEDQLARPKDFFPAYIRENVDNRLLALFHMPEIYFSKLREDLEKTLEDNDEKFDDYLEILAEEEEQIPVDIVDALYFFNQQELISLENMGDGHISMLSQGLSMGDKMVERRLDFFGARIIENELDMNSIAPEAYQVWNMEVHLGKESPYEYHLLIERQNILYYLTIGFERLEWEDKELDELGHDHHH